VALDWPPAELLPPPASPVFAMLVLLLREVSFASAAAARPRLSSFTIGTTGTSTCTASRELYDFCPSCLMVKGPLPLLLLAVGALLLPPPRVVRRRSPGAASTPLISSLQCFLLLMVEAIACPAASLLFSTILCGDFSSSCAVMVCCWWAGDRAVKPACLLRVLFAGRAMAVSSCITSCDECAMHEL